MTVESNDSNASNSSNSSNGSNGSKDITDPVEEIFCRVLRVPPGTVTDDLAYGRIPGWDSLGHVDLVIELESRFGCAIDEDTMIELTTVGAIRAWAEKAEGAA